MPTASENEELETLESVLRGLADLDAGQTEDLDEAFHDHDEEQS